MMNTTSPPSPRVNATTEVISTSESAKTPQQFIPVVYIAFTALDTSIVEQHQCRELHRDQYLKWGVQPEKLVQVCVDFVRCLDNTLNASVNSARKCPRALWASCSTFDTFILSSCKMLLDKCNTLELGGQHAHSLSNRVLLARLSVELCDAFDASRSAHPHIPIVHKPYVVVSNRAHPSVEITRYLAGYMTRVVQAHCSEVLLPDVIHWARHNTLPHIADNTYNLIGRDQLLFNSLVPGPALHAFIAAVEHIVADNITAQSVLRYGSDVLLRITYFCLNSSRLRQLFYETCKCFGHDYVAIHDAVATVPCAPTSTTGNSRFSDFMSTPQILTAGHAFTTNSPVVYIFVEVTTVFIKLFVKAPIQTTHRYKDKSQALGAAHVQDGEGTAEFIGKIPDEEIDELHAVLESFAKPHFD